MRRNKRFVVTAIFKVGIIMGGALVFIWLVRDWREAKENKFFYWCEDACGGGYGYDTWYNGDDELYCSDMCRELYSNLHGGAVNHTGPVLPAL